MPHRSGVADLAPTRVRPVRAAGVTYAYGRGRPALSDVDFECGPAEIVALVGPNGAGKTTLLRMLAGEIEPRRGTLHVPPRRDGSGRVTLGYAAEAGVHFESLSGTSNGVFFARAAGLPRTEAETSVHELFSRLGLAGDEAKRVSTYSFGARRKLLLVEALAHRPTLALLDEPFAGLDRASRDALADLLRGQRQAGGTVVLASHDLELLPDLVDRVVFVHAGRVVTGGTPAELLSAAPEAVRFEFVLEGPLDTSRLSLGDGLTLLEGSDPIVVESPGGPHALPEACRSLLEAGARIRGVTIRGGGLAAAFRRATGAELDP